MKIANLEERKEFDRMTSLADKKINELKKYCKSSYQSGLKEVEKLLVYVSERTNYFSSEEEIRNYYKEKIDPSLKDYIFNLVIDDIINELVKIEIFFQNNVL